MSTTHTSTGDRILGLLLLAGAWYGYTHYIAKPGPVPLPVAPEYIGRALPERLAPAPSLQDSLLAPRPRGLDLQPGSKAAALLRDYVPQAPRPLEGMGVPPRLPKLSAGGFPPLTDAATPFGLHRAPKAAEPAPPAAPANPVPVPAGNDGWEPFPKSPEAAALR